MRAEYGKVIESFYWACKANKQMICNDAVVDDVLASKGSLMQGVETEAERKRKCQPNYVSARTTGSSTESLGCGIIQEP